MEEGNNTVESVERILYRLSVCNLLHRTQPEIKNDSEGIVYTCMHVCMYVCMYAEGMYIHVCMYVCMYSEGVYIHVCKYVCTYVCMYAEGM